MELRHLRYFVAVAEALNFRRAAERLHIAQPPLSQQIQQLEAELGVRLLERGGRPVRLTEAGAAVLEEARRTLRQAERVKEVARDAAQGEAGRLRVGLCSSAPYTPLPRLLQRFREQLPEVELLIVECSSEQQREKLLAGDLDVGALRLPLSGPMDGLTTETLCQEGLVVALPAAHALCARAVVPLKALRDEAFVSFPASASPSLHGQVQAACRGAGFAPRLAQEALQMQTIVSLVAAGLGVALVPATMRRLRREGVEYRPLSGPIPKTEMALAWPTGRRSRLLERLLEIAGKIAWD